MSTDDEAPKSIALPEPHGSPRWWPHLAIANHPIVGEVFRILAGETIIGRGVDADIRPVHGKISRRHARVLFDFERLTIEDLGSSNGTLVGGVAISGPCPLAEGHVITLGGETKLGVTYSNILDTAVRPPSSQVAEDTADFFDWVRIARVGSRALLMPLTFVLVRLDLGERAANDKGGALEAAMRKVVAVVRDTVLTSCLIARSSKDELVLVLRMSPGPAAVAAERIRVRIQSARSLNAGAITPTTLTAAVLAVPANGLWAPETILCELGAQGRPAIADQRNRLVLLSPLDDDALMRIKIGEATP